MSISQSMFYEIAWIEQEERIREAERFRRARNARTEQARPTAARTERRFPFFRRRFIRSVGA